MERRKRRRRKIFVLPAAETGTPLSRRFLWPPALHCWLLLLLLLLLLPRRTAGESWGSASPLLLLLLLHLLLRASLRQTASPPPGKPCWARPRPSCAEGKPRDWPPRTTAARRRARAILLLPQRPSRLPPAPWAPRGGRGRAPAPRPGRRCPRPSGPPRGSPRPAAPRGGPGSTGAAGPPCSPP